jgi:hypothetical protein
MKRHLVALAALLLATANPTFAYLKFGVTIGNQDVTLRWQEPSVQYFILDRGVPGVTAGQFADTMRRAFDSWQNVETSSIAYSFGGFTASLPGEDDGRSTLGFMEAPEDDRVLASTSFLINVITGELIESDIFFNSIFSWSVSASGQEGRYDLESIAVHEIGHLSGLGHSAIGETSLSGGGRRVLSAETVMFPFAFRAGTTAGRSLRPDDIAGISDIYPDNRFNATHGSISGRVTKNGQGIYGAHIVAFNMADGSLIGNFSLNDDGEFSIAGLSPGAHVVRVEPLDDADIESFFDPQDPVDLDIRGMFFNRLVVAPRGGDSGSIEIQVVGR